MGIRIVTRDVKPARRDGMAPRHVWRRRWEAICPKVWRWGGRWHGRFRLQGVTRMVSAPTLGGVLREAWRRVYSPTARAARRAEVALWRGAA